MASRNSFLDSPSFRRITTPSQRSAVESRRRSSGFVGGSDGTPIRRETEQERVERTRQERLRSFQSELSDSGSRLTPEESRAILEGRPVSEVREQVASRERREGFASLQRDLSRSGDRLTPEEARLIADGEVSPSEVRSRVEQRRGREFTRGSGSRSFIETSRGEVPVSEGFARRTQEEISSGRFARAQEEQRGRELERFASQSDELTVVSGVDGPMLVTRSGEGVGGVSLTEFASFDGRDPRTRVVTPSGRDVTPRETVEITGFVSPAGRTPFSQTRAGRLVGSRSDADAFRDFVGGVGEGLVRPGDSFVEVFQVGESGRVAAMSSTRASTAGQFVGVAGAASTLGLGIRAGAFVVGAARQPATRVLSSLGFRTGASRQAAGFVAAPVVGAGLLAPEVSQRTFRVSTGRSSVGTELLGFGVNRAVEFGAAGLARRGARTAFSSGRAFSEGSVPLTRRDVVSGIDEGFSFVLPTPERTISRQARVRAGQPVFVREFTSRGVSTRFLNVPSGASRRFVTGDGLSQTTFSLADAPVENPDFDLAMITGERGEFLGATRVFRGSSTLPVASGFTPEASLLSAQNRFSSLVQDFPGLQVGTVVRDSPPPITISRSELRSELRFLQDFTSGRRVQGSVSVDDLVPVQPRDQLGLEAFGDLSFSPASRDAALRSLQQPTQVSSPVSNLIFADPTGGLASVFMPSRSVGRFSSAPPRSVRVGASRSRVPRRASRSVDDISFGFVPRIAVGTGIRSALFSSQRLSGAQRTPFSLGQEDILGFRGSQSLRPSQRVVQDTALRSRTVQDTELITIPRITTPFSPRVPGRRTPRPPRTPRTPRIPELPNIDFNFGISPRRRGRTRSGRREEFNPSLVANFLGITGERSRVSTGIEVRPIIL